MVYDNFVSRVREIFRKVAAFFGFHGITIIVEDEVPSEPFYVVVDLEWNQYPKWVHTPTSQSGVVMPHEIIQIGAVKVDANFRPIGVFTECVRLEGRRRLSKHVARVIQKTQEEIDSGIDFRSAYANFSAWCEGVERFITWGTDDYRVLQNNLAYYGMPEMDRDKWYDAQMIFARQVRGDSVQTALAKAAEVLGVRDDLTHHDALNDSYITAGVCARLDMQTGMAEWGKPLPKKTKARQTQSESRLFLQKKFVSAGSEGGFETRAFAKKHCVALPVLCPTCGDAMKLEPSLVASGDRWMRMACCEAHGKHLVRYRIRRKSDGMFVWTCTVYAQDAELEEYYNSKVAQKRKTGNRKRHHGGKRKQPDTAVASGLV